MSYDDVELFYLGQRWRSPAMVLAACIYLAFAFITRPDIQMVLMLILTGSLAVWAVKMGTVIRVCRDGVQMYSLYKLKWSEVKAARKRVFFGLPYLYITRMRGLGWWLPLYFKGSRDMLEALAQKAPEGNPIRQAANANNGM